MNLELGQVRIQRLHSIKPSSENDKLYRPISPDDPEIVALAQSIRERGVLEPLVITSDNWILSGHRRYVAARLAGLESVPCRVKAMLREDDPDGFLVALREHNRQREKSFDEKVRESVVSLNPEEAYASLIEERKQRSRVNATSVELRGTKVRPEITDAKTPFLNAIIRVLEEFKEFWPLSERFIHYKLLNDPPLVHASKPGSHYRNELRFSKSLSELITRARIAEVVPEEAIADETRPVTIWQCHREPGAFIASSLENFLKGYWRDLMHSQPNHVELMVEKNTAEKIIAPVAMKYCIPMTSGRGFCSLPPRIAMKNRFLSSGKEQLVIIVLSDFDPDGEEIAHSFARSMRDDFQIPKVMAVKAGLTLDQVKKFRLPSSVEAKKTSTNYHRFAAKYGADQNAYELEAMPPKVLQQEVCRTIDSAIDRERFNRELAEEKKDAVHVQGLRQHVTTLLKDFGVFEG